MFRILRRPLVAEGKSYRQIAKILGLSKNTVMEIVKRERIKDEHN